MGIIIVRSLIVSAYYNGSDPMPDEEHAKECQEQMAKLTGRKVIDCSFKAYENNCWRFYIVTDDGKLVMTFCPDWSCPVVEHHEAHHEEDPEI